MIIDPYTDVTGLVLAGGQGSRMGGLDKGLQPYRGLPLARQAMNRLGPQVRCVMINANRNLDAYRSWGAQVWPDEMADFPGPLAGMLAGLMHCETPYLATVPCDSPHFPLDLVVRLVAAVNQDHQDMATAYTREGEKLFSQPVFSLMHISLLEPLRQFLLSGERKTGAWARTQRNAQVVFEDNAAFANFNTLAELDQSTPAAD